MRLGINWEIYFDMPKWVERIHDYVWEPEDDDE
jgi:hypothetical protein